MRCRGQRRARLSGRRVLAGRSSASDVDLASEAQKSKHRGGTHREGNTMTAQPKQIGGGRRSIGDVSPKLAELTDDVLFEDVWNRPELAACDRSLITAAALITGGNTDQLVYSSSRAQETG